MVDQNTFLETVQSVKEIIRTSPEPLSREEIQGYFKDMELNDAQQNIIYEYFMSPEQEGIPEQEEDSREKETETEKEQEGAEKYESRGGASAHFQMYLDEIKELPKAGEERIGQLYERLQAGDVQVIGELSSQWLSCVLKIAGEYENDTVLMDDIVQEGNIGLLMGLQQLAEQKNPNQRNSNQKNPGQKDKAEIDRFLTESIRQAIEQYLEEEAGCGTTEQSVLGRVSLIHEAMSVLAKEKGETPSLRELSEYTKLPVEEISDILALAKEVKGKEA